MTPSNTDHPSNNAPAACDALPSPPSASPDAPLLTTKEIHQLVLRVLELAALREGGIVSPGSPTEVAVDRALIALNNVVANLDQTVPLAAHRTKTGIVTVKFTEFDFKIVAAYDALVALYTRQRRAYRADARARRAEKEYSRVDFGQEIKKTLSPLVRVTDAGAVAAATFAEDHFSKPANKPSEMAGEIMARFRLPRTRMCQTLKQLSRDASIAAARQQRGHVTIVREFLTCLQVPKEKVIGWATALVAAQTPGADLEIVLPGSLKFGTRRPRRRRATYSLRDVFPAPDATAQG